jgi:extradiol dioxygenase family protein
MKDVLFSRMNCSLFRAVTNAHFIVENVSNFIASETVHKIHTYCDVYVTNKSGSSSNDWIYLQLVTHSLVITLTHRQFSATSALRQLQFIVSQALGFSVSTSRFPAMDLDVQIVTVSHSKYYT